MPVQNFTAFVQWVKTFIGGCGEKGGEETNQLSA